MTKPKVVDLFGKYKITRPNSEAEVYHITVGDREIEGYYFTNLDTAMLMCLIKKHLHNKPDHEQEEFARVMAAMINMYRDSGE